MNTALKALFNSFLSRTLWRFLFGFLLVLLCFLSFKPNPAMREVSWIPKSAAEQFDLNDLWKNFVGFLAMGFTAFLALPEGVGPTASSLQSRHVNLALFLCGIIIVIELIQVPIPTRWCDPKDMLAGSAGVFASWPLAVGFRSMFISFCSRGSPSS